MKDKSNIDIQKISGDLVGAHVYANVGGMVEFILNSDDRHAPFSWEDIDTRPDPGEWDLDRLNAYLVDEMSTTWEDVTGDPFDQLAPSPYALVMVRNWIEQNLPVMTIFEYARLHNLGTLDIWDWSHLRGLLNQEKADIEEIAGETWETWEEWESRIEDEADTVRDYIRDNADSAEIFEWWAISDWLASELGAMGEIILDASGLAVWGRQTTGQAIKMDYCIQSIAMAQHERWSVTV